MMMNLNMTLTTLPEVNLTLTAEVNMNKESVLDFCQCIKAMKVGALSHNLNMQLMVDYFRCHMIVGGLS